MRDRWAKSGAVNSHQNQTFHSTQLLNFLDTDGSVALKLFAYIYPAEVEEVNWVLVRQEDEGALESTGLILFNTIIELPVGFFVHSKVLLKGTMGIEIKFGRAAERLLSCVEDIADGTRGILFKKFTEGVAQTAVNFTSGRGAFSNLH